VTRTRSFLMIMAAVLLSALVVPAAWAQSEQVIYSEGFENSNGGYTFLEASNPVNWMWGNASLTPAKGPGSCHAGTKCWGTNMGAIIPPYKDGSIISPAIQLPPVAANQQLRIRFWAFASLDGMYDRGQFFISKDASTWTSLAQLYNNMEMSPYTAPSWHKYEFGIDPAFANGPVYLRFRAATPNGSSTFYCGGGDDLSGLYLDDVAISLYTFAAGTLTKNLDLRAWEDPSTWASCPWVSPWNGEKFALDNDIYSVARYSAGEYTDYYKLAGKLVPSNGIYPVKIQERAQETSYTDYVALMQIDHAPQAAIAPDSTGKLNAYVPSQLVPPLTAVSSSGADVLSLISAADGNGFAAYSGDTVALDFGTVGLSQSVVLVLRAIGFVQGQGLPQPYTGAPAVIVETQESGQWVERGRLLPRFDYATAAFDLRPFAIGGQPLKVRLRSVSHDVKYNSIDYVGLYTGSTPAFAISTVAPITATANNVDILPIVSRSDGNRYKMTPGGEFYLEFPVQPQPDQTVRDFVLISKGYYEPMLNGTYLIYTHDGTNWVQRDSFNFPGSLYDKLFDLSMFLPDPAGEYKVRIWQDYQYEPAGIDQVSMTVGGTTAPLNYAWDFRNSSDIFGLLLNADTQQTRWSGCPRNRLVEARFTAPGVVNIPPSTNPVFVTDVCATPKIHWTYIDTEKASQALAEIQVWTGPNHTGTIVWNPPTFTGTATVVTYAGPALTAGATYYASVRANDGTDWGAWSETSFTITCMCGDLNGDGKVDIADYNIMKASYGKKLGQPGYSAVCDFDKDGIVSLKDYTTWYACYVKYR